ncbi:hypothetical protein DQ384_04580 [Sphaerisporangium album]|uniref:Uncharacterized protein n=1 Tax=Sphaerisporangium album TaxID=509200 RepID=A0A367FQS8_9ACTN|nr:hypothetical protein [Sphaerisporangium album]RCG32756.1 hypothetical protein DQ384_04580 [Sphaerisporangium album]
MSDYRYYEFLALDRPLTLAELAEVRALSGGAEVTATGFTGEYKSGDFGGDPAAMMERYYDAHLYTDDSGTRQVMLRLPKEALDLGAAEPYLLDEQVEAWVSDDHLVLDLLSEEGEDGDDEDDAGPLALIADVRADLASGDLRPLYLAWLAAVGTWERDEDAFDEDFEDEPEPPVPAGLATLSPSQRALAGFLRLDPDLLATAATASVPERAAEPEKLAEWIAALPASDKNSLLLRVATGEAGGARLELLRRFHGETKPADDSATRRTVAQLLDAAAEARGSAPR